MCYYTSSAAQGIDGAAPLRDTAIDAALAARRNVSSVDRPVIQPSRKYPENVSPAAVVSTAFVGTAGWK